MTSLPASRAVPLIRDRRATVVRTDVWPDTARLMPWAVAGFMALTWLLPFNAITLGPLPVDRTVLMGVAALWLLALAHADDQRRPRIWIGPLHLAVLVFVVIGFLSLFVNLGLLTNLGELHLATKKYVTLLFEVAFFVISASVIRREEVGRFATFMVGLACFSAVAAIVEYRSDFNLFYDTLGWVPTLTPPSDLKGVDFVGRQTTYGPTDVPLELSLQLAMALPFAVLGVLTSTDQRRRRWAGLAAGVLVAGIFATERKTGIISMSCGGLVLL